MKFIALVEYDYPVEHESPVKAELVLNGGRVGTKNVKIIAVDRRKSGLWITRIDDKGQFRGYKCSECGCKKIGVQKIGIFRRVSKKPLIYKASQAMRSFPKTFSCYHSAIIA